MRREEGREEERVKILFFFSLFSFAENLNKSLREDFFYFNKVAKQTHNLLF